MTACVNIASLYWKIALETSQLAITISQSGYMYVCMVHDNVTGSQVAQCQGWWSEPRCLWEHPLLFCTKGPSPEEEGIYAMLDTLTSDRNIQSNRPIEWISVF